MKKYVKIQFLFFLITGFLFFTDETRALTLTPGNLGGSQVLNGVLTYYYPIQGPPGFCSSANQITYPQSLAVIDPNGAIGLQFQIANTTDHPLASISGNPTPASDSVSIVAEYAGDGNHTKITLFDEGNGYSDATATPYYVNYGNTDYQPRSFGIALKTPAGRTGAGFCDFISTAPLAFTCQPDAGIAASTVSIRIGLVAKGNNLDTNNAAYDISQQINIVFASCPPNTDTTGAKAPSVNFKLTPGDKRIKVENFSVSPTDQTQTVPQFALLYGTQEATANPITYASSTIKTPLTGTSNLYYADNLANDQQYCFSIGYVNYAGLVTTGDTWGNSSLPNVQCQTPSEIEGFLDRSTCFIATAMFDNEFDTRLEVLRQFRDQILSKNILGKSFIHWYYSWSPNAARWIYHHPKVRPLFKPFMYPLLWIARSSIYLQDFFISEAKADEIQPYIESLKKKHNIQSAPKASTNETEALPKTIKPEKTDDLQPYITDIKKKNPVETESFGSGKPQPYIESLKAGHELKVVERETVNKAAGFSLVASSQFNISSNKDQANSFNSVYNTNNRYNPSGTVFFEYQFIHDRYWGSLGLMGSLGVITTKGKGVFIKNHNQSDDVLFSFFAVPMTLGPTYRLSQLRYLVPFVHIGLLAVPMLEMRNDPQPSKRALSRGYDTTFGLSLNLDWISRKNAWEQYDNNGLVHTYLMLQWEYLRTISSSITFNYNGLYAGLMFEF